MPQISDFVKTSITPPYRLAAHVPTILEIAEKFWRRGDSEVKKLGGFVEGEIIVNCYISRSQGKRGEKLKGETSQWGGDTKGAG